MRLHRPRPLVPARGRLVMGAALLFCALLDAAGLAHAQPLPYSQIDYGGSGTITASGTPQNVVWPMANASVRCVQNPSSATEDLFVSFGGTASTSTTDLQPSVQQCWPWDGSVSVYAATTGHAFIATEGKF
jgi:hypothetical protein